MVRGATDSFDGRQSLVHIVPVEAQSVAVVWVHDNLGIFDIAAIGKVVDLQNRNDLLPLCQRATIRCDHSVALVDDRFGEALVGHHY